MEGEVEIAGDCFEAPRLLIFRPGDRITVRARRPARLMFLGGSALEGRDISGGISSRHVAKESNKRKKIGNRAGLRRCPKKQSSSHFQRAELAEGETKLTGPDLAQGIPSESLAEGQMLVGHAHGKAVLLVRTGDEFFAVSPHCTHYNGPLAEGLIVGETVRCPWHHACFDLRTGEAIRAPALSPIACWDVARDGGVIKVGQECTHSRPKGRKLTASPERIVIVGGGAAGFAAAEMLRRQGYQRSLVMLSSDAALPYDRPNLSKDYLAGTIPFDYVPLRDQGFYQENGIEIQPGKTVAKIDIGRHEVLLSNGEKIAYDRLLLATGAEPVRLTIPGAERPHVYTLRSLADSNAIIKAAKTSKRAVVIGASFIGLRSLLRFGHASSKFMWLHPTRSRWHAYSARIWVNYIRTLHQEHGVIFHLETKPKAIDDAVHLENGDSIKADLVVAGIGVRPRLGLAEECRPETRSRRGR